MIKQIESEGRFLRNRLASLRKAVNMGSVNWNAPDRKPKVLGSEANIFSGIDRELEQMSLIKVYR